jgi:serine/threonine protein kinase
MENSVIEKKILQKAIFPFIVGFVRAFHDSANIFLLMEYLRGKEMFEVIREMSTLNKPIARYYFGCIMLSIQYLHANNIIYRDIRPENSVVDH